MTLPGAELVHSLPGRLRVRIPERRNRREYFARVRDRLAKMEGVESVETNWATGSVLLLHNSTSEQVARFAQEQGLFEVRAGEPLATAVSQRMAQGASRVVQRVNNLTRGEVDFPGLVVLGFTAAGLVQVLRRNAWPAGMTLFWYAATLLKDVAAAAVRNGDGYRSGPNRLGKQYVQ
jgi:hypothetical protein